MIQPGDTVSFIREGYAAVGRVDQVAGVWLIVIDSCGRINMVKRWNVKRVERRQTA